MTKPEQPRLSPEEWMRRWEQAPNEQRLAMVATLLTAAKGAEQCLYGGHDELQTRLEATQRHVTDLDGQLQRAKEALRRAKESLDRVRAEHRDTCLLATGKVRRPAWSCSVCDALGITAPEPSTDDTADQKDGHV